MNVAEIKTRTVHGKFWHYDLVSAQKPMRRLKTSRYLHTLYIWASRNGWTVKAIAVSEPSTDEAATALDYDDD